MTEEGLAQLPKIEPYAKIPLQHLEKHLLENQVKTEAWLRKQWLHQPPPFYSSVDLRNAGYKIAPVDTNLFPAGFNNLNPNFLPLYIQAAQMILEDSVPGCLRVLLIPENHTRNPFYFESIAILQDILIKAGYEVRIGSLLEELHEAKEFDLPSGQKIRLEPIHRTGDRIGVKDFSPCFILLNNDLASGIPPILENLSQPIIPPLKMGWAHRLKSSYFQYYAEVAQEFSEEIGMDPWLINPLFKRLSAVDFVRREGESDLVETTRLLLDEIQKKYDEYGVTQKPYVVIKAEASTYGIGVLVVRSADEIPALSRKKRTGMSVAKGNRPIDKVIIQEGVYTQETWQGAVAEPVVYMLGRCVVGGFYRVHTGRGVTDNLNAPGMHFAPLPFKIACNLPQPHELSDTMANRFYVYSIIARLALVAASREQDGQ